VGRDTVLQGICGRTVTSTALSSRAEATVDPRGLRIAMVSPRFAPYVGGIETHVHEISRRLVHRGYSVTVLTTDRAGTSPPNEVIDGFTVERYPTVGRPADLYLSPSLGRALGRGEFDVVHVQGVNTALPFLALRAARRYDIPAVLTFHTGGHSSRFRTLIRSPQWAALGPSLRRTAHLIAVCEYERETFLRSTGLARDRFSVIRNGAERLPVADEQSSTMAGDPLVLSVGRLERYKGHHRVIAAMPELLRMAPGARLGIVGRGPHERDLRLQVAAAGLGSSVTFTSYGPGERSKLGALLARADVVTLLSDYEAHPVAVMEALALGTPALVADGSGLSELGRQGLVRTVSPRSTPGALAAAVLEVARGGPVTALSDLTTWEECADLLAHVYEEVAR
jgi:glycosyltransferase involved in cell wall biosynthesis